MTLFSSSAAFRALMNIMGEIYERKSYRGVWQIVASVAFSILFLVTIYLSLAVLLTGEWLFQLAGAAVPPEQRHPALGTGSGCAFSSCSAWCSCS